MLVFQKYMRIDGRTKNCNVYMCNMCHKNMNKEERILISSSDIGENTVKRKWDLCEHCMKVLEKNVNLWYSRIKKN